MGKGSGSRAGRGAQGRGASEVAERLEARMSSPAVPHPRSQSRALVRGLGVLIVVTAAATAGVREVYDLCGSCGELRVTREVLHVPVWRRFEERGWLGSLVGAEHRHEFVRYFTTTKGWLGCRIACRMPAERRWLQALESAHEELGDHPGPWRSGIGSRGPSRERGTSGA